MPCELCDGPGGEVIWQESSCRVVRVGDQDYPGFCRVIWREHTQEMTDLTAAEQRHFMHVVFAVERALRRLLNPDKVNLASLGNVTPHLHWHVIPRFHDDRHYPNPVWGPVAARAHRVVPASAAEIARSLRQTLGDDLQLQHGSRSV